MLIRCDFCDKSYRTLPSWHKRAKNHFCSIKCHKLYRTGRARELWIRKKISASTTAENHWRWKDGINNKGYRMVNAGFKKRKSEHRLAMERFLGRLLKDDEVIHHINGDKTDNSLNNLQVVTKREHDLFHMGKRRVGRI